MSTEQKVTDYFKAADDERSIVLKSYSDVTLVTPIKYFLNYNYGDIKRVQVPNKSNSVRLQFPTPFGFSLHGYSRAGVEQGEFSTDKFWVRLTTNIEEEKNFKSGSYTLYQGLREISVFLEEVVTKLPANIDGLPEWWNADTVFIFKTGLDAAFISDHESLSYSFFIHPLYTKCGVLPNIGNYSRVQVPYMVGQSGNSWFELDMNIKMVDLVYNEDTNKVEVTGFINLRTITLYDLGQNKTPLAEDVDYKDLRSAEQDEELAAKLRKTANLLETYYVGQKQGEYFAIPLEGSSKKMLGKRKNYDGQKLVAYTKQNV